MTKTPEANRRYVKKHRANRTAFIRWLKSLPCFDCGRRYPPYVMDFDHVRGEKRYTIGGRRSDERLPGVISLSKLQEEVMKCDVVCSNCHRIRTFTRGQDDDRG